MKQPNVVGVLSYASEERVLREALLTCDDPKQAAQIANAIADAYVQDQINAKTQATQKTSQWLADRLQVGR